MPGVPKEGNGPADSAPTTEPPRRARLIAPSVTERTSVGDFKMTMRPEPVPRLRQRKKPGRAFLSAPDERHLVKGCAEAVRPCLRAEARRPTSKSTLRLRLARQEQDEQSGRPRLTKIRPTLDSLAGRFASRGPGGRVSIEPSLALQPSTREAPDSRKSCCWGGCYAISAGDERSALGVQHRNTSANRFIGRVGVQRRPPLLLLGDDRVL